MLVDLRAREGGLRAALRAEQPTRLGRHPGGGHRPAARIERRIMSADPHAFRGAHPTDGGVVIRAVRPAAKTVTVLRERQGRSRELKPADTDGLFEGVIKARSCRSTTSSRSTTARGRDVPDRGPVPLHADGRRARPAPRGRGPPRGDLRPPRRARDRARGRARARRSRSGRPPRSRSRWSATSTAGTAACTRCARSARAGSGSCSCPRSATARTTSTRSPGRTATASRRPTRTRSRPSTRRRPPRSSTSRSTSGATRSGWSGGTRARR